ncbi:zinc finger, ZZ type [Dictyocaulus viviparus]|uniref:Zinc finger, ZZ type n=2 Tax=Strongyloidea TaxID=27829 RepID=A0A0D8Y2P9_DICVI|nr:zinc finger, ZZ type [Dictyocaulus viviparus]
MPRLNARDSANWQLLTKLRHWLNELERDASLTVDLCDRNGIREMANTVQGIMDHIRMKIMDVVGIQDVSSANMVKHKARELVEDMERVARQCEKRRATLLQLGEQSRAWEVARDALELWMHDADAVIGRNQTEESTDAALRDELTKIEELITELDQKKDVIKDVNSKGNAILDTYTRDDAHTISHELSKLNMRWSKFNDNLRIRRAVLEATLKSHSDFNTAFSDFEEWLNKIAERVAKLEMLTTNTQSLKDTAKRHDWIQQHKILEAELNAHESVLTAVEAMGRKLGAGLGTGKERSEVHNRLNVVAQKWEDVRKNERIIGWAFPTRLTEAEQEWEKLTNTLSSLISWIEDKSKEMLSQQPVGGSLSAVMAQSAWLKNTEKEMEVKMHMEHFKGIHIREAITNAHSFLMQHDLRPKIHRTGVLAEDDDTVFFSEKLDVEQRRCGLQIHADCEKLKEKWAELGNQFTDWNQAVHAAALRLQELERALAECQLHLSSVESELEHLRPVERLRLEELKDARRVCEALAIKVGDLRIHVDDANDACGRVLAADTPLDQHPRNQLDAVNERFLALKTALRVRSAALRNALADFGPSSEHFLNQSVTLPWQRAISKTNHLPYYIDHTTEKTQWEHPVWVEMSKELSQFNRVKFIAYRTAMKLRALQKRLCLDLVDIPMLEKCFSRLVGLSNEESPGLEGMVSSILPLFEQLNAKHPQMVRSVALAVDLCINFLLNLFDPSRDGLLRVLSFKIALVVLSNAPLEEKYRCELAKMYFQNVAERKSVLFCLVLFNLVAQDGQADQKHVALLLYDLIQIPRLVGEAAAFGGSNVEPSVRSCFEMVRLAPTISLTPFLEWLKQEPQSVVWLPVMHRLATAEFAKHQAKCNVCKMFPIVGLRYRCLRCFNLDLCQNCFFSQRTAKKHKLKHPMQEYAVPTTSSEDARDFARMVRNKFSRSKNSLGYLPVDVADEGRPLAAPPTVAQNPATEALHQRSAAIANRLAQLTVSQPADLRDERVADIQSPAQLINQVEQMQKDELDQVLQRLQLENLELKRELERRKMATTSTPDLDRTTPSHRSDGRGATLPRLSAPDNHGRSVPSLQSTHSQNDVMDEARALRLHKQRLEHRSRILEQQNEQLELQLRRLKKVIEQQKGNGSRTEWSAERDSAERSSHPSLFASPNMESRGRHDSSSRSLVTERPNWKDDDDTAEVGNRSTRMQSLLATVDDLGRAMENLVVSVVYDSDQEQ